MKYATFCGKVAYFYFYYKKLQCAVVLFFKYVYICIL